MLVIDKPILTDLARAFRRRLDAIGVTVGHQTALNLCISALHLAPSNRALAIIDQRPLLVASPSVARLPSPYAPTVIMTQLTRLAEWLARSRPDLGPPHYTAADGHGALDACCIALRASAGGGGRYAALRHAPEVERGPLAYVLEITGEPHPAPDSFAGSPGAAGDGALAGVGSLLGYGSRPTADLAEAFNAAMDETVCRPDPSSNMRRGLILVIQACPVALRSIPGFQAGESPYEAARILAADWRGEVWSDRLVASLDGYPPLAGLARTILIAHADGRAIGIRGPDGSVTGFEPAHLADDSGHARITANPPIRVNYRDHIVRALVAALSDGGELPEFQKALMRASAMIPASAVTSDPDLASAIETIRNPDVGGQVTLAAGVLEALGADSPALLRVVEHVQAGTIRHRDAISLIRETALCLRRKPGMTGHGTIAEETVASPYPPPAVPAGSAWPTSGEKTGPSGP